MRGVVSPRLVPALESAFSVDNVSGVLEESVTNDGSVPPGPLELEATLVSAVDVNIEALLPAKVKSVAASEEAVPPVRRWGVP